MDTVSVTICMRHMLGIMSGDAMQSNVGVPETESESASSPNFNDQDWGKPEDRRLTEVNVTFHQTHGGNNVWGCYGIKCWSS